MRVICRKTGSYNGARGNVVAQLGDAVKVDFESSSLVEKRSYFEPVGSSDDSEVVVE